MVYVRKSGEWTSGSASVPDELTDLDTTVTGAELDALKSKVDGIEANADVTDAENVAAAGAFIKSSDDLDDITDGTTNKHFTATEKAKLSGIEEGAQVNTVESLSDLGVTASASELNILDGATLSTTELNHVDGVTSAIQTQLNGKVPTTRTVNGHALSGDVTVSKADVGLGNVDNTSDATKNSAAATLTNKRVTKRVATVTSNATPTLNTDNCDAFTMTLSTTITNFSTNLSGSPTPFQQLLGRITASGGDRGITLGSSWNDVGGDFPDTIPSGKTLYIGATYNSGTSKWDVLAWRLSA